MTDPGFTGALINIGLDVTFKYVIKYAKTAVRCEKNCKKLQTSLEELLPIVDKITNYLKRREEVFAGSPPADEDWIPNWVTKLNITLKIMEDAKDAVSDCNLHHRKLSFMKKHTLSDRILKVHTEVEKLNSILYDMALALSTQAGIERLEEKMYQLQRSEPKLMHSATLPAYNGHDTVWHRNREIALQRETKSMSSPGSSNYYLEQVEPLVHPYHVPHKTSAEWLPFARPEPSPEPSQPTHKPNYDKQFEDFLRTV